VAHVSDVGCKTVANMIKGRTPEEIRKLFNIVNDFTPEEEVCLYQAFSFDPDFLFPQAQIKKENVSVFSLSTPLFDADDFIDRNGPRTAEH
jgi:hypothetical protein